MTRTQPSMVDRHNALRHHLHPNDAARNATPAWTLTRIDTLLDLAGIDPADVGRHIAAESYRLATGQTIADNQYGMASREPHHIYVRPHGTRGDVERVIAHEVTHLTHWKLGHRAAFFQHAQALLDRNNTPDRCTTAHRVTTGATAAPRASPDP